MGALRWGLVAVAATLVAAVGAGVATRFSLALRTPTIEPLRAKLDPALRAHVLAALGRPSPGYDPIRFALEETGARLHFGLSHRTSLAFSDGDREGNCVEYAQLFAAIFAVAAPDARAWPVHSADARLFGQTLPWPGWHDHDWDLVVVRGHVHDVDPTLWDADLGSDISFAVVDQPAVPVH